MGRQRRVVYLLHFDRPYHHACHYLGFTRNLEERIRLHREGKSQVALMRALAAAGIGFTVVRVWEGGDRALERKLKRRGGAARLCPICNPDSAHRWGTGKTPPHMRKRRKVAFTQKELAAMRRGYRDARAGRPCKPGQIHHAYMRGWRNGLRLNHRHSDRVAHAAIPKEVIGG
jgi:hypothetical protein